MDLTDLTRADTQQTLTLTVLDGPPQVKTRQDVSNMSFAEFATLTAVSPQTPAFADEQPNIGIDAESYSLLTQHPFRSICLLTNLLARRAESAFHEASLSCGLLVPEQSLVIH